MPSNPASASQAVDDALIRASQEGDRNALARLLELIYDSILLFALKWTQCLQDAEDITQQVCIKLATVIKQFQFKSAFTTWLYRIVVNTAQDWRRKQSPPSEAADYEGSTSENMAEQDAELDRVLGEIEGLGKGIRETALLVYGQGFSHKEAADILDVKESTISWRLHQIRHYFSEANTRSSDGSSTENSEVSQCYVQKKV